MHTYVNEVWRLGQENVRMFTITQWMQSYLSSHQHEREPRACSDQNSLVIKKLYHLQMLATTQS